MIDLAAALTAFNRAGIDIAADLHTLTSSQVEVIVALAKQAGYRKPRTAPGSTGRMYFQALQRRYRQHRQGA